MSGLACTVPPGVEPLDLDEVKNDHLRVTVDDDDDLITGLIVAAREFVEGYTNRALITQTWEYTIDRFPTWCTGQAIDAFAVRADLIQLPRPNLLTVEGVTYLDTEGAEQTLDPSIYTVSTSALPGHIALAYGQLWPTTRYQRDTVTIEYTAGYGADADAVPSAIKTAMKLLIAQWYENREATVDARYAVEVPFSVKALLGPYCLLEVA